MGWTRRTAAVSVLLVMDEHRKQAGLRLAQLREARGLSQEELSHLAGVSVKTISRFENGRHDGARRTVRAIAKALKVNEHDIVGEPPTPLGLGTDPYTELRAEVATVSDKMDRVLDDLLSRVAALELGASLEPEVLQRLERIETLVQELSRKRRSG